MSISSSSPIFGGAVSATQQPTAASGQRDSVVLLEAPIARARFVDNPVDHGADAPTALIPGRVSLLAQPEPRGRGDSSVPGRGQAAAADVGMHAAELIGRLDQGASARLELQAAANRSADVSKGGRGGATLALANELAGLQALRRRNKPIVAMPRPVDLPAPGFEQQAGALDARRGAAAANPIAGHAPQDSTEDHVELKLIKAETLAVLAEISADLTVMGTGDPVGLASLAMETGASGVGLIPEAIVVILRAVEYVGGKRLQQEAVEHVTALGELELRLNDRIDTLAARAGSDQAARPDSSAEQAELQHLKSLSQQIGAIKAGFEVSRARGEQVRHHAGHELVGPSVALTGGAAKVAGTAVLAVAEHGGSHALAAAGAATAGAAAVLMLPFAVILTRDNYRQIAADETNLHNAQSMLAATPARHDRDRTDEVSGLQRGLAKMAQARSSPNESRVKAWLFGLGIGSGVLGLASSALILAEALGAAVASAVSIVGLIGSGVGIGMGLLFVGYLVYKRLSRDTTYSVKDLHGVLTDPGSRLGLELQHRQTVKAGNQLLGQVMKTAVLQDPGVRSAVLAMARGETPQPSLRSSIESALLAVGQFGRERDIESGYQAHAKETAELIEKRLGDAQSITIGFEMTQPGGSVEDYAMGRLGSVVRQSLDERVQRLDSLHTPFLSQAGLHGALEKALRLGAVGRDELLARLKSELPLRDTHIDEVLAEADSVTVASELPKWAQELEREATPNSESPSAVRARRELWAGLFAEAAPEMARLAAMRKLLRRDKEALLYASIGTLQRLGAEVKSLDVEGATDEQRARAAQLSAQADRLRNDFSLYGVKRETLNNAVGARSLEQMVHATGLIAKELQFE